METKKVLEKYGTVEKKGGQFWLTLSKSNLLKTIKALKENFNIKRVNTITGLDDGTNIWLIYHLTVMGKLTNLKVKLPRKNPTIPTIAKELPSARLYERDIHEMLGIKVEGMEDKSRLFLPDSYKGKPPLLKN